MNNNISVPDHDLELADILRMHRSKLHGLNRYENRVINNIMSCRTSVLGGHKQMCDNCGHIEISYNSCRNRNCPKCQGSNSFKWLKNRLSDLLPIEYFHVVFTFPKVFNDIFLYNKVAAYKLLFKSTSETLKEVTLNPNNLGANIGFISVLHTWDQQLNLHPHIHCIVPGGGLAGDKSKWISCKKDFFVAVRKLSVVFRGKLLSKLEKLFNKGKLSFKGRIEGYKEESMFKSILKKAARKKWVVYSKKPFAGPLQVFKYLGFYTHKIGISNERILSMDDNSVTFKWKDRRNNNEEKQSKIDAVLFIKRFLLHIVPKGFMKIRYYGIMGNKVKKELIPLCKNLIAKSKETSEDEQNSIKETISLEISKIENYDYSLCPVCEKGNLKLLAILKPEIKYNNNYLKRRLKVQN